MSVLRRHLVAASLAVAAAALTPAAHAQRADVMSLRDRAQLATGRKDYAEAASLLRRALDIERRPEIIKQLADVQAWAGKYDESIALYQEYLRAKPNDTAVKLALAGTLSWTKDPAKLKDAVALYDEHLAAHPTDSATRLQRARVLSWSGRISEAATDMRAHVEAHPDDDAVLLELARVLSWGKNKGELEEATRHLARYLDKHPDSDEAQLLRARALLWSGHGTEAVEGFKSHLARHPEDEETQLQLAAALASDRDKAHVGAALQAYDDYLAKHPDAIEVRLQRGRVRSWAGQHKEAAEDLFAYIKARPEDASAHLEVANVLSMGPRPDTSLPHYEYYLAKNPKDRAARLRHARVLLWTANYAAAEEKLDALHAESMAKLAANRTGTVGPKEAAADEAFAYELDVDRARLLAQTQRRYEAVDLLDDVLTRPHDTSTPEAAAVHKGAVFERTRLDPLVRTSVTPRVFAYVDKIGVFVLANILETKVFLTPSFAIVGDVGAWRLGNASEALWAGRANVGLWKRFGGIELEATAGPRVYEYFPGSWGARASARGAPTRWLRAGLVYTYDDAYYDLLQPGSVALRMRGHGAAVTAEVPLPRGIQLAGRVGTHIFEPQNQSLELNGSAMIVIKRPLSVGYNAQFITWRRNEPSYWSPQEYAAHLAVARLSQEVPKLRMSYDVQLGAGIAGERITNLPNSGYGPAFGASGALIYAASQRVSLRAGVAMGFSVRQVARDVAGGPTEAPGTILRIRETGTYWWTTPSISATFTF